jgi:hypothetical protein
VPPPLNTSVPIGAFLVQQGAVNLGQFTGLALGPNLLAAPQGANLALDAMTPVGGVPASRTLFAGGGLIGGGDLAADRTFTVGTNADGSIVVNPDDIQVGVLATDVQHGVRGGGTQHAVVGALAGFMSPGMLAELSALATSSVIAGAGLTGGGLVDASPTLDVGANPDGSIVVGANTVGVGILASDAQHGVRGGGTQHALVVPAGAAGFMSGADKSKLDGITAGAAIASVSGTAPIVSSGGTTPAVSITAASGVSAGSMSAANFTKLAGIQTEAHRAWLSWGNSSVSATTTTRFLSPWYTDALAPTSVIQYRAPSAGTLKNLRVRHNVIAGNGNAIVYTIRINGVASTLLVSMASTASDGSDLVNTIAVAAGDLIDLQITKAASVGTSPSDILAIVEIAG